MDATVESFIETVDGIPMGGLVARVENPRAVIVAMHGGAVSPHYFDAPGHPRHSLLRAGAAAGYTVIAPFRPGYGPSFEALGDGVSPARQVDLAFEVIDRMTAAHGRGSGVFTVGHSIGCVLTMRMAADVRGAEWLGIELSGTGILHPSDVVARLPEEQVGTPRPLPRELARELFWEPTELYLDIPTVFSKLPRHETEDGARWPALFPALAPHVAVPVRISLAEHEKWWEAPPRGLASMAELFTASPRVLTAEERGAGHNISVGVTACDYHARVLAFVDECVPAREGAGRNEKVV
ncbi:alpha/beta hydrolase [Nocardia bovistercoris]|uniref:Alpha/beta fold hydrolase n=1 Tax=Nocardia bovistercoris TaxID=2785916 RepID=A0A931I7G1_9NOCA|nr:alpha/beta fold hydrolase [Nocardia bovistercoris]MBH0775288.1 alpha/beta fold hydrolase [Nocardia bovistercoris]